MNEPAADESVEAHPVGDPDGRRLAQRRAAELAEAGRLAVALASLVDRGGLDTDGAMESLIARIKDGEQSELMRANGRIEPRRRFGPASSNPLRERRPLDVLSIDESGRSYIQESEADPSWFALGAVAMSEDEAAVYQRRADELKVHFLAPPTSRSTSRTCVTAMDHSISAVIPRGRLSSMRL